MCGWGWGGAGEGLGGRVYSLSSMVFSCMTNWWGWYLVVACLTWSFGHRLRVPFETEHVFWVGVGQIAPRFVCVCVFFVASVGRASPVFFFVFFWKPETWLYDASWTSTMLSLLRWSSITWPFFLSSLSFSSKWCTYKDSTEQHARRVDPCGRDLATAPPTMVGDFWCCRSSTQEQRERPAQRHG